MIRIVSWGRLDSQTWSRHQAGRIVWSPVYCVKIFEALPRKDGVYTWRLVENVVTGPSDPSAVPPLRPDTTTGVKEAERMARSYAKSVHLPFVQGVRHNQRTKQVFR